jgi:hypothetical protein
MQVNGRLGNPLFQYHDSGWLLYDLEKKVFVGARP